MDLADSQSLPGLGLQHLVCVIGRIPAHDKPPTSRRTVSCSTPRVWTSLADGARGTGGPNVPGAESISCSWRLSTTSLWTRSAFTNCRTTESLQCFPGVIILTEAPMRFEKFSFGSIRIDGTTYEHDVVIDRGEIRKRKKKASRKFRDAFGHTPLSVKEKIPWECRRLVIGTGTGALPVMKEVKREAKRRKIKLLILPTVEAIKVLQKTSDETNAVLHVTC